MKKCVYAGTFDPPTNGHKYVIDTCLKIFDEVVVAVMENPSKSALLSECDREKLLKQLYKDEHRVKVKVFSGAAVDLLEEENTPFYVRGIRNTVDLEYENANFFASKKLKEDMVTIYIPAEQNSLQISSSMVKSFIKFGKDYSVYVPEEIQNSLKEMLERG